MAEEALPRKRRCPARQNSAGSQPEQKKDQKKFSDRPSTLHTRGIQRPKSHSGKRKPGSRKGGWTKTTAKLAGMSSCPQCAAVQDALDKMQLLCSELTAALKGANTRAERAEKVARQVLEKQQSQPPLYLRPVPNSWMR